ncbi:MAG: hypothetical protein COB67_03430 [SAR324 cluster bacterium]|uniref:Methyl-accepting transducer domain-containing protein n=1 Tax=SAR324 cluster bacterium TaxID=2024889 RepID=A0A2A4T8Q2_9DELT|nr:MAG: hypothetical protein COB67_03430 [SAR324 cluster bacterium]
MKISIPLKIALLQIIFLGFALLLLSFLEATATNLFMLVGLISGLLILISWGACQWLFSSPVQKVILLLEDSHQKNIGAEQFGEKKRNDEVGELYRLVYQSLVLEKQGSRAIIQELEGNSGILQKTSKQLTENSEQLAEQVEQITTKAERVVNGAQANSQTMTNVVTSANDASHNISTISAAVTQLSANISTVAAAAEQASANMMSVSDNNKNISTEIAHVANSIDIMSNALERIYEKTQDAARVSGNAGDLIEANLEEMIQLENSSNNISGIVKMVNEIADQTNMLALNATIEAASAGTAGKGFAVVAEEIKQLAQQTTKSNADISIEIDHTLQLIQETRSSVYEVNKEFHSLVNINKAIALSTGEQSTISTQIAQSVESVSDASKSNAINVSEASLGIREITRSAAEAAGASNESSKRVAEIAEVFKEIASSSSVVSERIGNVIQNIKGIQVEMTEVSQITVENRQDSQKIRQTVELLAQTILRQKEAQT